jgi:hypothetical protein
MTCGYCGRVTNDEKIGIDAGGGAKLDVCRCQCGVITEVKTLATGTVSTSCCPEESAPSRILDILNAD